MTDETTPPALSAPTPWGHVWQTTSTNGNGPWEFNWPDGWVQREPAPHADRDASEPSMRERAERAESVARGQQKLIEAQRAEIERLNETIGRLDVEVAEQIDARVEAEAEVSRQYHEAQTAEAEVERLLAEIADRESERADLRDRVEKAEAAVGRVEALTHEWERTRGGIFGAVHVMEVRAALRGDQ